MSRAIKKTSGNTTSREVTSGRVDAPVGKGQYITNSTPDHEVTSSRVDAPIGKGQYITDSTDLQISDRGTCTVRYLLSMDGYGGALKSRINELLGANPRANLKIPYQISYTESQRELGFNLAKKLLLAGADVSMKKEITVSYPIV